MQCPECGTTLVLDPGSCYYCPSEDCDGYDTYDEEFDNDHRT